ncbi:hypothetical protein VSP20_05240 [Myroides phaeus]|uniref:hypothetical protein n=1 Tax=Myroides phaeus TaxID=702745 RepID=UPI002DB70650|nr:hypothetical protein [Myroides phaeus]MEC4116370.1 hypothetical protein [Myroides phaeus]
MKKLVKFFIPDEALNDATVYYCNLIEEAFVQNSFKVIWVKDKTTLEDGDIVFIIRPLELGSSFKKKIKIVSWFQGVGPEEYILLHNNSFKAKLGFVYLSFFECKMLKKAKICIFVSEAMRSFYENKYKINLKEKSVIIPCYNKKLDLSINSDRYCNLSFVYAGGLFAWQCIEKTLSVYKEVHKIDNNATLTLLTGQTEAAEDLVRKFDLKNVDVKYVKLDKLQEELSKYKYGFLLREDIVVNNVATPTKMNSYLASGLIPLYSPVVDSFNKHLRLGSFDLQLDVNKSSLVLAQKIIDFQKKEINSSLLLATYKDIFNNYYNDSKYIKMFSDKSKYMFNNK